MSLFRPDARKFELHIPQSNLQEDIVISVEAVYYEDYDRNFRNFRSLKEDEEALVLTVGDLMSALPEAWENWLVAKMEEHDLSHGRFGDCSGCDLHLGIPSRECVKLPEYDKGEHVNVNKKVEEVLDEDEKD